MSFYAYLAKNALSNLVTLYLLLFCLTWNTNFDLMELQVFISMILILSRRGHPLGLAAALGAVRPHDGVDGEAAAVARRRHALDGAVRGKVGRRRADRVGVRANG